MSMSYLEGIARAIREAMKADPRVILMGSRLGGHFIAEEAAAMQPVYEGYSNQVYMDVPIAEFGLAGAAVGYALGGGRPLISFNVASFLLHGLPPIANEAPNVYYSSGGLSVSPVTFYTLGGLRRGGSSQHSHRLQSMMSNFPGLQVLAPASAHDAYGLLKWCLLESRNPTIFFAHSDLLLSVEEDPGDPVPPVGTARVCRAGSDVTIVAHSVMVPRALCAADKLAADSGIAAEVIDLRSLVPLDKTTVIESVRRTTRVLIADESHKSFGAGAELSAVIAEEAFHHLRSPVYRIATADVPIPYNLRLEEEVSVTVEDIRGAAVALVGGASHVG